MKNVLKAAREAAGLSMRQLAKRLGVAVSTVSRVESGQRAPTVDYLKLCEDAFGCDLPTRCSTATELPRSDARWLSRAFPAPPLQRVAPQPLRAAFRAACQTHEGRELLGMLDAQRRPAAEWTAIRQCPENLNGDEQLFLIQGLLQDGIVHPTRPEEVRLPVGYQTPPGHRWLALHVGPCVYFPQLTLALPYDASLDWEARKIRSPRLDFLVAVASKPAVYINQEIDGPSHIGRSAADADRERAVRLPTLRISSERLLRADFWTGYEKELRRLVEAQGATWPKFRRQRR